jgi:hypothetical protein
MEVPMKTISQFNTAPQQAQLVAAARLGETSGLIEHIYVEFLPGRAWKLARMFRDTCGACLDAEDIIQAGAEYMLYRLDNALQAVNPIGYLLHAAQFAMLHYCQEQRSSIRVPHTSQHRGVAVPTVVSLDAPLPGCEDLTLLDLVAG